MLPLGWLVWYSVTDDAGLPTLGNFTRLASDPTFALPYLTALGIAAGVALGACGAALPLAWLVARTRHAATPLDPHPRHSLVRYPAVSRRDRLGAARRAE